MRRVRATGRRPAALGVQSAVQPLQVVDLEVIEVLHALDGGAHVVEIAHEMVIPPAIVV